MKKEIREALKHELECEFHCEDRTKDIIVIVHDQLHYVQKCINSILNFTKNFKLHIWDNDSSEETKEYLKGLEALDNVFVHYSDINLGFIKPNNILAKGCDSDYLILLNSDTRVSEGWDKALLGYLQYHKDVGVVGYMGGLLGHDGECVGIEFGYSIDYVMGWCLCVPAEVYKEHGLFNDEDLEFAYFEDSDLCLRVKEAGLGIYSLFVDYVFHEGSKTVQQVEKETNISDYFLTNKEYMQRRWNNYLQSKRILAT